MSASRIGDWLENSETATLEVFLGLASILTGVWLAVWSESAPASLAAYLPHAQYTMPAWAWGLLFIGTGLFRVGAVRTGCLPARVTGSAVAFFLYASWVWLFAKVWIGAPGVGFCSALAGGSAWAWLAVCARMGARAGQQVLAEKARMGCSTGGAGLQLKM